MERPRCHSRRTCRIRSWHLPFQDFCLRSDVMELHKHQFYSLHLLPIFFCSDVDASFRVLIWTPPRLFNSAVRNPLISGDILPRGHARMGGPSSVGNARARKRMRLLLYSRQFFCMGVAALWRNRVATVGFAARVPVKTAPIQSGGLRKLTDSKQGLLYLAAENPPTARSAPGFVLASPAVSRFRVVPDQATV